MSPPQNFKITFVAANFWTSKHKINKKEQKV